MQSPDDGTAGFGPRIAAETVTHMLRNGYLEMDIPGIQFTADKHGTVYVGVERAGKHVNLGDFDPAEWLNNGDAVASDGSVWCDQCANSNAVECPHRVPAAAWCAEMILGGIVAHLVDDIYNPPPA